VTVVDGEKAVLECRVSVKPAAEVTWCVDTSFAVRSLRVAENGASQPLTLDHLFVQKTLYDKPPASRGPLEVSNVTRSSVTLSWLALTSNGGAAIVAYVIERPEYLSPTWTHVARVRPQTRRPAAKSASASRASGSAGPTVVGSFSRPAAGGYGDGRNPTCPIAQSLCTMPAVTFSIRFGTGH